jgi:glycogen debranching enzyme
VQTFGVGRVSADHSADPAAGAVHTVAAEAVAPSPSEDRQPYLHDLVCTVRAPAVVLSAADGQIRSHGVQGGYVADRRVLSRFEVTVDGEQPTPISSEIQGGARARFTAIPRGLGDRGADPTVVLTRSRHLHSGGWSETITVTSFARGRVDTEVVADLGTDLSDIMSVKSGRSGRREVIASAGPDGLRWQATDGSVVSVTTAPVPSRADADSGRLTWTIGLGPRQEASIRLEITTVLPGEPAVLPGPEHPVFAVPAVHCADTRLGALLDQSLADLAALQLSDPLGPGDVFLAAGAPWFLTLFGRDSLWAARLALPCGTDLAAGTLRTLARRQGHRVDIDTAEEPGKIPHEIRTDGLVHHPPGTAMTPAHEVGTLPLFYGTVDATPLWISLLHDAWRWGLPEAQVRDLLDPLEGALAWMRDYAIGPSGFLQYADDSGHGLTNQGWKDSEDSIQFSDGRLAQGPIALCEVQAYAYSAARHGAALLDAFGRPGADEWRDFADGLQRRFRDAFWVEDAAGSYPAIALDGTGRPVDTVTSNLGHLLGTGLLDDNETALVVARLAGPELSSGYGLRTMSTAASGFNPLAYHAGSVWTHDTAIAILGLRTVGTAAGDAAAAQLIDGLLGAAPSFGYRMPELYGGQPAAQTDSAMPYPAACRPQAWSAASAIAIITALLGLSADPSCGVTNVRPLHPSPVGPFAVSGLQLAGRTTDIRVDADGKASITTVS